MTQTPHANQNSPHNDDIAPAAPVEAQWESQHAEMLAQAVKLGMEDYSALKARLRPVKNNDSYATSAAYYLMTCRKGLWQFTHEDQFVLFGWHPNVEGQTLVFNPLQQGGLKALQKLTTLLPPPPAGVHWARAQDHPATQGETLEEKLGTPIQEQVLDWVYPVYDLSTAEVSAHAGKRFRDVRKNLYRAEKYAPQLSPLSAREAFNDALQLIHGWSARRISDDYTSTDLSDPQACILKMMRLNPDDFDGFMVYGDNKPAGLCVWEKSDFETTASFISVSRPDMRGLGDYIIYKMCDALHAQGKAYVCIGGSESLGLDAFKRKFNPAHALDLKTVRLKDAPPSASRAA